MDLIDLFIGSEGTLGVITEVTVALTREPETTCAILTFWDTERHAVAFSARMRETRDRFGIEAVEYFGPRALDLLRGERRTAGASSGVPECLPADAGCAVYLDVATDARTQADVLHDLAACLRETGGDPDQAWAAVEPEDRERFRRFMRGPTSSNSLWMTDSAVNLTPGRVVLAR